MTLEALGRVESTPTKHHVYIRGSGRTLKAGDIVQFGSKFGEMMRSGTARIAHVDPTDDIVAFDAALHCLVPAICEGDYVFAWETPCTRCKCKECERVWSTLVQGDPK